MTRIIPFDNRTELEQKAVDIITDSIRGLLQSQEHVVLAVPGGRSVSGIFGLLREADIPWRKVHIFMVDERLVPVTNDDSNFKLAKEHFIGDLVKQQRLPKENVHPFTMDTATDDFGISDYETELRKYGGCYDIVLLSSGEDGHVGALYPDHHSVKDESECYLIMNDSPKPPKDRMTMSRKLLLRSRVAIMVVLGEGKRHAFEKFLDKALGVHSCPAKLVEMVPKAYVLTDLKGGLE